MPELGQTLSQSRVARGLTLEDCERDTRISKRYLDALEREDWNVFPAPVYRRAFLRTYAQYLGHDPAQMMRQFEIQTEEPAFTPLPEITAPAPTGSMNYLLAGGVVVFLLVAGAFLYFSSSGGGSAPKSVVKASPTITTEAQGGGPRPAAGKPLGEIKKGIVPDLTSVRLDDALSALRQAGLSYVVVETDKVSGTAGVVSSQDPAPGTKGGSTTSVTLVVPRS